MKGKRNEAGIATTKAKLYGLFEAGRMAHQFRYFLNAEGPPGPADGEHAVPLNAQVVTDLATTKAELIKMGHQQKRLRRPEMLEKTAWESLVQRGKSNNIISSKNSMTNKSNSTAILNLL